MTILWAAVSLLGWLGASHSQTVEPFFDLRGRACVAEPDLASALSLSYSGRERRIELQIVPSSACIRTAGGPALYRLLRLPAAAAPYIVTVVSQPSGGAILLPHAILLDANGWVKREYTRNDWVFRAGALTARFRSHPDETYLLVESDAGVIGGSISRIAESVSAYVAPVGTGYFSVHTGSDETSRLFYSLSGNLTIGLEPLPDSR